MINSTKAKERSPFSRGTTRNSYLFVTASTIDQFLFYWGVLNTPIILSFILLLSRDMSDPGHPNSIKRDDSFSFQNCKIRISIKSHIAVY